MPQVQRFGGGAMNSGPTGSVIAASAMPQLLALFPRKVPSHHFVHRIELIRPSTHKAALTPALSRTHRSARWMTLLPYFS